jgi:hypothetical protein
MADNTTDPSRLLANSVQFRDKNVAKNRYKTNNEYVAGHPDALSTGDELGKDELNGNTGSATDIKERQKEIVKNKFNSNRTYNASNA